LRVKDIEASIEWYERCTPLRLVHRTTDQYGSGAWLADPQDASRPFVLALSQFQPEVDPFSYAPATVLGPYAHIGIEVLSREAVDNAAREAEAEGALTLPPTEMPPPIGYICFVEDPDGNTIQFAFDQGTYTIINEAWGELARVDQGQEQ
jgi:catechol 2,3-dioxygenase-like lactoylglutathione lyase family enzyme